MTLGVFGVKFSNILYFRNKITTQLEMLNAIIPYDQLIINLYEY